MYVCMYVCIFITFSLYIELPASILETYRPRTTRAKSLRRELRVYLLNFEVTFYTGHVNIAHIVANMVFSDCTAYRLVSDYIGNLPEILPSKQSMDTIGYRYQHAARDHQIRET